MSEQEFLERQLIITGIIRLMAECNFSDEALAMMVVTSRTLREIMEEGGNISDDTLFRLYDEKMREEEMEETHDDTI